MNLKTILQVAAVAAGGSIIFGGSKIQDKLHDYEYMANNLRVDIAGIKSISIRSGKLAFKLDIQITNPTDVAFDIPGRMLSVDRVRFATPTGKPLGLVDLHLDDFAVPKNGHRLITNIPVEISLAAIGDNLGEVLDIVEDTSKLRTSIDISVLGRSFTIDTKDA